MGKGFVVAVVAGFLIPRRLHTTVLPSRNKREEDNKDYVFCRCRHICIVYVFLLRGKDSNK